MNGPRSDRVDWDRKTSSDWNHEFLLSHAKMSRDILVTSSELCDPIGDRLALG